MVDCKVIGTANNVLRLKLRTDTPQLYEDIHLRNITLDGRGQLISIQPWKQYFDLKGQPQPTRTVKNVTITNVRGTFGTFGKINPNPGDVVENVLIKNVDVKLTRKNSEPQVSGVKGVIFRDVTINGTAYTAPPPTP